MQKRMDRMISSKSHLQIKNGALRLKLICSVGTYSLDARVKNLESQDEKDNCFGYCG